MADYKLTMRLIALTLTVLLVLDTVIDRHSRDRGSVVSKGSRWSSKLQTMDYTQNITKLRCCSRVVRQRRTPDIDNATDHFDGRVMIRWPDRGVNGKPSLIIVIRRIAAKWYMPWYIYI